MRHSKRFGCHVYPLLFLITLAVPGLQAQNSTGSVTPAPAAAQAEPENPQQNQIRLAQQAQARIRARREQRKQKVVQDTYSHKFEAYGGGGYIRFRPGGSLQHINESAWNVGFTDYIRPKLGITADLRGYYGTAFITPNPYNIFKPSITQYTYLAGPQYRFLGREHWAVSGVVLAGVAKGNFSASTSGVPPGTAIGLWSNGTNFAVGLGVPVDYNLSPALAVRLRPDYLFTTFGSSSQVKNIGFSIGVVYRFGRQ
jgi:opacity protein-like surface antigen